MICALAFLVTLLAALYLAGRHRLSTTATFWAATFGICGAILGGFAWTILSGTVTAAVDPAQILEGGKAVFGAILGAATAGAVYLRAGGYPILKYADATVAAAFLGYAVARIGCFVNGCCFGIPTDLPWGVHHPSGIETFHPVHPTQLYHALAGLAGFVALMQFKRAGAGTRLAAALVIYGTGRFLIEFLRGDAAPIMGGLDLNHIASLLMVLIGLAIWAVRPVLAAGLSPRPHE